MSSVDAVADDKLQVVLEVLVVAAVTMSLRWISTAVDARTAPRIAENDERAFEWMKACERLPVESNTYCKAQRPNLVIIVIHFIVMSAES